METCDQSVSDIKQGMLPVGVHPATMDHHDIAGPGEHGWNLWMFMWYLFDSEPGLVIDERLKIMTYDEVLVTTDLSRLSKAARDLIQERAKYPPGILSKAGYYLYNDTPTPRLDEAGWIAPPTGEDGYQDLYLFYYKKNMARALKDYTLLCGAASLVPRYVLGLWYSRCPALSAAEWQAIVGDFAKHDLPLDLVSLDNYWHKRGYNGWDWYVDLLGEPETFLRLFKEANIHVTANTWPNNIPVDDSRFGLYLEQAGLEKPGPAAIRYDARDKLEKFNGYDWSVPRQAQAFMDVLHKPIQDKGIDFWWVDQVTPVKIDNVDNQLWTINTFYNYARENYPDRRPLILGRACGLGAHRYPIHFTGDTWSYWATLENQVEHTLRAGHIGQSLMSHDIGGFMGPFHFLDPELYVRWVQFGVLSPVFRLHSSQSEKRPWLYEERVLTAFKTALHLRMELLPYLYTLAWQSTRDGLPICRSNCLQNPDWEQGYEIWDSYYLGDRIYAAPVVQPGTLRQVILPPGKWYSAISGELIESDGRQAFAQVAPFDALPPHYYKAGSLMVKQPYCLRAAEIPETLCIEVYPLGEPCRDTFTLYEDDGLSRAHAAGEFSQLRFDMEEGPDGAIRLEIQPADGRFAGQPLKRNYEVRVIGRGKFRLTGTQGEIAPTGEVFRLDGLAAGEKHIFTAIFQ